MFQDRFRPGSAYIRPGSDKGFQSLNQIRRRDTEMLPIILILALGGTVSALDAGSSVWFYSSKSSSYKNDAGPNNGSEAECSSLDARNDKSHQIYSKAMDIDRSTCWPNEMDGVKYGARRRSIWIDPPVVANEADTDKTKGCLRL
jgi:hypothetical protein